MDERDSQNQATRIETLIQEIIAFPESDIRVKTEELLHELLDMYGTGLMRVVEMTTHSEQAGQALLQTFAEDDLVGSLLLLHGLHPVALEERVRQAVEKLQPAVRAQKGEVALVQVAENTATLSLQITGGCQSCSASAGKLKQTIEKAIYSAAPDLDELRVEEIATDRTAKVPVKFIPLSKRKELAAQKVQSGTQAASARSQVDTAGTR